MTSTASRLAVERFGRIDTWVNNAGVGIWGVLEEVSEADMRRLFDTNFWGLVNGSLVAIPHLEAAGGGALINIGSVLSDRAVPLQGIYAASKHAVKGFTDALRMELGHRGSPVVVTLVKPWSAATPLPRHVRNYTGREAKLPPPVLDRRPWPRRCCMSRRSRRAMPSSAWRRRSWPALRTSRRSCSTA